MGPKNTLMLVGVLSLVGVGVYLDRKWKSAGGTSGIASNIASALWDNAAGVAANLGGAVLDALPSSQVTGVVDQNSSAANMANPVKDTGTLLYESALMGGG